MSPWKVLLVITLGCTCFALALGTFLVPISMTPEEPRWLWGSGLLIATIVMSTLFTLFLQREDRKFTVGGPRRSR